MTIGVAEFILAPTFATHQFINPTNMSDFVTIQHDQRGERVITRTSWDLMKNSASKGDIRQGWRLVGPASAPRSALKNGHPAAAPVPLKSASFIPSEIEEAEATRASKEEAIKQATLISGVAQSKAPAPAEAAAPAPVAPAKPEPPVVGNPTQQAPPAPTADDLASITGIGPKVAELLKAAGIITFAQLAAATVPDLNKVLDASNMGAKKAQVPTWKMKAAELAKK